MISKKKKFTTWNLKVIILDILRATRMKTLRVKDTGELIREKFLKRMKVNGNA